MAELVDALDLGSSEVIHQSSSLCIPTIYFNNCFGPKGQIMKNLIILGSARSGKTTTAKKVKDLFGFNILSIDSIVTAFQNVFPDVGITHHHNGEVSKILAPFISSYVKDFVSDCPNIKNAIEGWHMQPACALNFFDKKDFDIVVLGYPDLTPVQALENVRKYAVPNDYTTEMSDEKLLDLLGRHINHSKFFKEEATRLNLPFYNTSFDRNNVLDKLIQDLKNSQ